MADAREKHHRKYLIHPAHRQGKLLDALGQGHGYRADEAAVNMRHTARNRRPRAGNRERQGAFCSQRQVPMQPRRHGHGGIAAKLAAHHLKPRLPRGKALCKAHLLGILLPPQKLHRHPGLHIPGHRGGDQEGDVLCGIYDRVSQFHIAASREIFLYYIRRKQKKQFLLPFGGENDILQGKKISTYERKRG